MALIAVQSIYVTGFLYWLESHATAANVPSLFKTGSQSSTRSDDLDIRPDSSDLSRRPFGGSGVT